MTKIFSKGSILMFALVAGGIVSPLRAQEPAVWKKPVLHRQRNRPCV